MCVVLIGCGQRLDGPPRYETRGSVTYNGQPVPDAQVVFLAPDLGVSRGAITDVAGEFEVRAGMGNGLPQGDYAVVVRPAPGNDVERINLDRPDIPQKYWDEETSDLTWSIVEGENLVELELGGG